jgi:hypothetical protein
MIDLSVGPGLSPNLCTQSACAANPCARGCTFAPTDARGGCGGDVPARVSTSVVEACSGFCGLQQVNPGGCFRYRSEDPACSAWCINWSGSCWETTPQADYVNGGAICNAGAACYGGFYLEDMAVRCVDAGTD